MIYLYLHYVWFDLYSSDTEEYIYYTGAVNSSDQKTNSMYLYFHKFIQIYMIQFWQSSIKNRMTTIRFIKFTDTE